MKFDFEGGLYSSVFVNWNFCFFFNCFIIVRLRVCVMKEVVMMKMLLKCIFIKISDFEDDKWVL